MMTPERRHENRGRRMMMRRECAADEATIHTIRYAHAHCAARAIYHAARERRMRSECPHDSQRAVILFEADAESI